MPPLGGGSVVRPRWLLFLGLVTHPADALAQDTVQARCAEVLVSLGGRPDRRNDCRTLAGFLTDTLTSSNYIDQGKANASIPPRDVQSSRAGEAVPVGSPAQPEAAPGVQPAALASAGIATAGTEAGTKALTSISINPTLLFGSDSTSALARWSRFSDLTVSFPLSDIQGATQGLDYLGVRARVNLTAANAGDQVFKDVLTAYSQAVQREGQLMARIRRLLEEAPDLERCARSIAASRLGDMPAGCNTDLKLEVSPETYRKLKERIALAREKADAKYLGLDLRFDTGDPTLGAVPGTDLRSFEGGLAWGRRFLKADLRKLLVAVRSRLGVRYVDPRTTGQEITWSVTGGLGLEGSRLIGALDQNARFTLGLDFDYADAPEAQRTGLRNDYLVARSSVTIPLLGLTSVTVGLTAPLTGEGKTSLSLNFGSGLLMSALAQELSGGRQ